MDVGVNGVNSVRRIYNMKMSRKRLLDAIDMIDNELDKLTEDEWKLLCDKGMSTDLAMSYTRGIVNISNRNGLLGD